MKIIQSILVKFQISQYQSSFPYLIHLKKYVAEIPNLIQNFVILSKILKTIKKKCFNQILA